MSPATRAFLGLLLVPLLVGSTLGCGLFAVSGKPLGSSAPAAGDDSPGGSSAAEGGVADPEAWRVANDRGNALNEQLFAAVKSDEMPAGPLEELAEVQQTLAALGDAKSAEFFGVRARTYRFVQAMLALDAGDAAPLQALSGAAIEAKGVLGSERATIEFAAKKGHCYTVGLKWKQPTGSDSVQDSAWTAAAGGAIQRYQTSRTHPDVPWASGICVTADTKAKLSLALDASGSKPRLQYVVMRWERAAVPPQEMLYTTIIAPDLCSAEAWKSLWFEPIPSSIVYEDNEPKLLVSMAPGQAQVTMLSATGATEGGSIERLKDQPEGGARFTSQFRMPLCSDSSAAQSAVSKQAARCHEAIDAAYDPKFNAAERVRDSAQTVGAREAAELRLADLREAEGKARDSKCGGVDGKLRKEVQAAFDAIVDRYTDGPLPAASGRMARIGGT